MKLLPPKNPSKFIKKDQWEEILTHFINVLKVNIFIINHQGQTVLAARKGKYGGDFWENPFYLNNNFIDQKNILLRFEKHGNYLEARHHFGLHSFAIPMNSPENQIVGYMVIGPVAINKRLNFEEYKLISSKFNLNYPKVENFLNEIKVLSFLNIKSILDLLQEVSKYILQLNFKEHNFHQIRFNREILSEEVSKVAYEIYSSICLDELLVTLLDVALNMTKLECGSIMILDKRSQTLTIKISRGVNWDIEKSKPLNLSDGISGVAIRENIPLIIKGNEIDKKFKSLLNRPEIKHSLIMPLCTDKNVFGVLNLHTRNKGKRITGESLNLVQNLSKLTSAAIASIHIIKS